MVEGLIAAAEMAEYVAARERRARDIALAAGDGAMAAAAARAAEALDGVARAMRVRAGEEPTGPWILVEEGGRLGWMREDPEPDTNPDLVRRTWWGKISSIINR